MSAGDPIPQHLLVAIERQQAMFEGFERAMRSELAGKGSHVLDLLTDIAKKLGTIEQLLRELLREQIHR